MCVNDIDLYDKCVSWQKNTENKQKEMYIPTPSCFCFTFL